MTFFFFVSFLDRDLCTKRELRIKDLQTTQQNKRLTNPNLSAKVHEEAKQRGKKMTPSNIQNTKKKSTLKLHYLFVVKEKREIMLCDDNNDDNMFVFIFFFSSFP